MSSTALQQQPKKETLTVLSNVLEKFRPKLQTALAKTGDVNQEIQSVLAVVAASDRLQQCSPESIAMAAYHAASLGLSVNPNLGLAYLIPRWNSNTRKNECSFQISYRGHRNKVLETGYVEALEAYLVYEKDYFEYRLGSRPIIEHKPCLEADRGEVKLVYSIARIAKNHWIAKVMTRADIEKHRAFSQSPNKGPWVTHWEQMALKTTVIALCKQLPVGTTALREIYSIIQSNEQVSETDYTTNSPMFSLPSPMPLTLPPAQMEDELDDDQPEVVEAVEAEPVATPEQAPIPVDERQQLISKIRDLQVSIKEKDKKAELLPKDLEDLLIEDLKILHARKQKHWELCSK